MHELSHLPFEGFFTRGGLQVSQSVFAGPEHVKQVSLQLAHVHVELFLY